MITKQLIEFPEYTINDSGIVSRNNKIRKHTIHKNGYAFVMLYPAKKFKYIHRLVAETFLEKPIDFDYLKETTPHGYVVNHKDGNKLNNSVSNLEWCTVQENNLHAISIGLIGRKVKCIETGEIFEAATHAAYKYNIPKMYVSNAANPKHNVLTAGGYHWEYVTEGGY